MDPHVRAAKHFKSAMLYYPGTEELQPDEVRVTFMGSTYYPNQSQSGMSIFVQLGNGDNIVFDLGIGSLRNYNSFSIPFNTINHVFFPPAHGPYERLALLHHVPADSRWLHAIAYLWPQRL